MRTLAIIAALTATFAGLASGQGDTCPDQRATNIDARSVNVGEKERCGVGLVLFGHKISVFGPTCYDFIFLYPAYQECQGESLAGHRCVPHGDLEVRVFDCQCSSLNIPFLETGIAMPDCDCEDIGAIGFVEDFKTLACD